MRIDIIPSIKEVKQQDKTILLCEYSLSEEYNKLVEVAEETFEEFGVKLNGSKLIIPQENKALSEGEYTVEITENQIEVEYSDFVGAYYGIVTLAQLGKINHNVLNICSIHDYPDMKVRSISDDISRGQVSTMENFKSILRRLSYWKYNEYFPYIEDTFDFAFLPSEKKDYALTGAEWKELCSYGKKYGVSVRPLVNLMCHFSLGAQKGYYPYILHYKNGSAIWCIDPLAPGLHEFVCKMLDEIVDAFGEGEFHCGGDETAVLAEIYGKQQAEILYCDYMNFLDEELKKRNCKMLMYGDMFYTAWGDYPYGIDAVKRLNKDITIVYWAYWSENEYPDVKRFTDMGRKMYVSPAARSYGRFMPAYITYENIRKICNYSIGMVDSVVISSWNDAGAILREENMQAFAIGGEFAWASHSKRSFEDLVEMFVFSYYGLENVDIKYFLDFYHYEHYVNNENVNDASDLSMHLCSAFFQNVNRPTVKYYNLHGIAPTLYNILSEAQKYIETLKPTSNKETFECFLFDMKRMVWGAKRASILPDVEVERSKIAEIIAAEPDWVEEHKTLHKENERLWMKFSRKSEWYRLDRMYTNMEESLNEMLKPEISAENK